MARAVSMAVMQATECSTVERRILKPSVSWRRPRVGVFSSDKENASQIYEAAKYMVENTSLGQPEHDPIAWAVDSRKEIHTKYGGVLKVYSADAATKHGYSFSAIIIDELHAQPNRRLWDVLTAGSNAARRQQAVIVLTTAGDDPDRTSIGWEVRNAAASWPGGGESPSGRGTRTHRSGAPSCTASAS